MTVAGSGSGPGPEQIPPRSSVRRDVAVLVGWATAVVVALVGAAIGWPWAVVAGTAVAGVVDATAVERWPFPRWMLGHSGLGVVGRRALLVSAVTFAAGRDSTSTLVTTGAVAAGVVGVSAIRDLAGAAVRLLRSAPVTTRNVSLPVHIPRSPWRRAAPADALAAQSPTLLALAVALWSHHPVGPVLAAAAGVIGSLPALIVGLHALELSRRNVRASVARAARAAWEQVDPDLVLYFAGRPDEVYQLASWLAPVERSGRRAVVVVRDIATLTAMAPTEMPVFAVVYNGTIADLPLSGPTPTLFVTHSGNNLAMLRRPEVRPVFVGHGDSDKPDSANRFARVYDEVWVAGPLGRERYDAAGLDLPVHEVGRPQLPDSWPTPNGRTTVLYAPTWEGWGDDPHHTSLPHVGPALVDRLLAVGVRVLYRPHPLTGVRNPDVRRAHETVLARLRAAGATESARTGVEATVGDPLDLARSTGEQPWSRADGDARRAAAVNRFWSAAAGHCILTGNVPDLHESFAPAHLLIADVSSVTSDWLATDRPCATVDTRGLGERTLRRRYPTAAGATVLPMTLIGIDDWISQAVAKDPLAAARRRTKARVLGATGREADALMAAAIARVSGSRG